uniref:Uncharacterized protein n=1 Tax=Heterorhabditis bacteriophora TaxID=37862 RepID=A0A1I7W6C5_HETBA
MGKNDRSPFGIVARHITNSIRILKDKKENRSWRAIMASIVEKKKEIDQNKKVQEMLFRTVGNVRNTTRRVADEEDSTKSKPNAAEMYENTILEKVPTVHTFKQDMKKLFENTKRKMMRQNFKLFAFVCHFFKTHCYFYYCTKKIICKVDFIKLLEKFYRKYELKTYSPIISCSVLDFANIH